MEILILGPIEVVSDGTVQLLGGMRERALLAVMALSPGQVLSSDRLIDALWGEALPSNPANALQALVSRLRRSLGADVITTRAPGYVLAVEPESIDAVRFRHAVAAAGDEPDPVERSRRYREALTLWRGAALADFAVEEFAQRESAALEELRLLAIDGRIAADLEAGAGAELVPELEELVVAHPLRERLRASQMLALYRAGRQADALRAYTAARQTLGDELGIEPGPELRALEEAILMQAPDLGGATAAPSGAPVVPTLPARLASFVGRNDDMAEVAAAFATTRLVTLTGPGGAGKTSLAIEVARGLRRSYPDGAWLVELGPLTEPARVPDALLAALHLELGGNLGGPHEVDPLVTIVEYLRNRTALLVIDNCEHVVDGAAEALQSVLLACPGVDVLATSRDRLGIPGELLWRVPPLAVHNGDGWADAVTLFVERARAVNPSFDPSDNDLALAAEICSRVDGLPLAIELAAARTRLLPIGEIAQRLETGIGVLAGGSRHVAERQQTLRATIDWSYELLRPDDREMFARLSVFHGSFTLDAAEAVAPGEWDQGEVLESVERLLDSSVLARIAGSAVPRYRMLETLRAYAEERLAKSGEFDEVMHRLLGHFSAVLAPAEDELRGPNQLSWMNQIEADQDTVRAVLDWSVAHAAVPGLRLAGMLGWFWYLKGAGPEARERLGALLAAAGVEAEARSRGNGHFFLSLHDSQPERVRSGFEAARRAYTEAGDVRGVAHSLAMIAAWGFDREETRALIEQAATLCFEAGYEWGVALVRFLQASAAAVADDIGTSARLAEDAVRRFAKLGDHWGQGYGLYTLGVARRAAGDYAGAEAALLEALEHARPMRLRREMAPVMAELGSIATMQGDYDRAGELLDQARVYADDVPFAGSQGMVRNAQGRLARARGDLEAADQLHRAAVALHAGDDNDAGLAYSYSCLGFVNELQGELAVAQDHHRSALRHAVASGDVFAVALGLEGIGATLVASGDAARGVSLVCAGLAARERLGTPLPSGERGDTDRALAAAAKLLDADEIEAAAQVGRELDVDAAVGAAERV